MEVTLYSFSKRINSTAVPSGGTTVQVVMKEESSEYSPRLEVNIDPRPYNYMRFNGKYYYIEDKDYLYKQWVIIGSIDPMATYRSNIRALETVVAYSNSNFNIDLPDSRIPVSGTIVQGENSYSVPTFNPSPGTFILQVVGERSGGSATGFTTVFAMTATELDILVRLLVTEQGIWEELLQYMQQPYNAIVSCHWIPVPTEFISGTRETIKLGNYSTATTAMRIINPIVQANYNLTIPWQYEDFRNSPPFTSVSIHLPMIGVVDMSASDIYGTTQVLVALSIDAISGDVVYKVTNQEGVILQTLSGNIASRMPIGQETNGTAPMIASAGGALAGLVTGNIPLAIGSFANFALASNQRGTMVNGSYGGRSSAYLDSTLRISVYSKELSQEPSELSPSIGRPLYQRVAISSLTGYVQTIGASVSAPTSQTILNTINSTLDGGFFNE